MSVRHFQQEAYDRMVEASETCDGEAIDSVFWKAAGLIGKDLKAMHTRSRNFELMLLRLIRHIRRAHDVSNDNYQRDLDKLANQAIALLARLGGEGVLR